MATRNKARKAATSNTAVTPETAQAVADDLEVAANMMLAILDYADALLEERRWAGQLGTAIDLAARKAGYLVDKSIAALGGDEICGGLEAWHDNRAKSGNSQDAAKSIREQTH